MFRRLPVILLIIITIILLLNPYLSLEIKQIIYAISLTVKSLILMLLPIVIFGLLYNAMIGMARSATTIIALILICVCASNFTSTFLSHYIGVWIYHFNLSLISPKELSGLTPAWTFEFPRLIANSKAMFLGIFFALIMGKWWPRVAQNISVVFEKIISKTLQSFSILITLFVAGFVVKMQFDGTVQTIIKDYMMIFLVVICAQYSYIAFAYALLSRFRPKEWINSIKNMLPAAMAGFSTMSSASVMPLTIVGAELNAKNKEIVRSVVPATVNIHLVGDCIAIPIFAYAVMKSFGMPEPSFISYFVFICYFVLAKFSVAAIPGGGIVVMLPVLESCFGFNGEMLSLMTALYILFDPVITSANVLGNGMFAKMIDKILLFQFKKKKLATAMQEQV